MNKKNTKMKKFVTKQKMNKNNKKVRKNKE